MKVASILPLIASAFAQRDPVVQVPLEPNTVLPAEPFTLDAIPLLGFGTWNLKGENATAAVSHAIQTGYRHIDCAHVYGNEEYVGKGIADGMKKAGIKREDLWITSKLWNDRHDANRVQDGLDKTLHNLGLEYLDLYHMHWPVASGYFGNKISYLDTYGAMTLFLDSGKVKHLGISNFSPEQLQDLLNHTSHPPSVHQMELHPYLQQTDYLEVHEKHGIHVTGYSPFAGSNPTYEGNRGETPDLLNNTVLQDIAEKRGCTVAQTALMWGMSRGTSVIPKSAHPEYIEENFHALECVLEKKDLEKIDKLHKYRHRYNNPSKKWKLDLYEGLEDSKGNHKKHS